MRVVPEVIEPKRLGMASGWPNLVGMLGGPAAVPAPIPAPAPAPPPTPPARIADELVREIPIGTIREEIIQKLGKPYLSTIGEVGEVEDLTYLLTSGSAAKLELANGKLTQLRILPAR